MGENDPLFLNSTVSLASRYDFGASLKNPWNPPSLPFQQSRNQSFPQVAPPSPSSIPWPEKTAVPELPSFPMDTKSTPILGSPRDLNDDFFPARSISDIEGLPVSQPRDRLRNHQRGYFDVTTSPTTLRRTPPGTPSIRSFDDLTLVFASRYNSLPPIEYRAENSSHADDGAFVTESSGESELSTPSIASPCSSPQSLPFLGRNEAFLDYPLPPSDDEDFPDSETHYRQFLSK